LWAVAGQTMNGLTSRSIGAAITLVPPSEDPSFSRYTAQSLAIGSSPGEFSIGRVPPGSYILRAKSSSGDPDLLAFQRIVLRPVPANAVTPKYSMSLSLSPPLSISGRLFVESREAIDLRGTGISLLPVDPDLPSPRGVSAQPDGQFVLKDVLPGTYVLDVSNLPQDQYVKAAQFSGKDILENPLSLGIPEAANPLQILVGIDGGRVQVTTYDGKGEIHSGANVVLVPDVARRYRRDQYRIAISGDDGRATLRGIPPGRYRLFAWEDLEPNAYLNSDFVQAYESFGAPVNIISGDNLPVSARLIPKE